MAGGGFHRMKCACMDPGHSLAGIGGFGGLANLSTLSHPLSSLAGFAGYEPLQDLNERDEEEDKDTSTEKQEELIFYNDDRSAQTVLVEHNLRASDLCQLLAVKNRVPRDAHWTLVEHWPDLGLERSLEDHEDVLSVHRDMQTFSRHSERRFVFRKDFQKYEFFNNPEQFFPSDMVVDRDGLNDLCQGSLIGYNMALTTMLNSADDSPLILSQVWVREAHKQVWAKAFLLLKDRTLYLSYKVDVLSKFLRQNRRVDSSQLQVFNTHKGDADSGVQLLCRLQDYVAYSCLNARNQLRAPTEWGICLRPVGGVGGGPAELGSLKCLSCDSERVRTCWITAMRLAKYGRQIRENYRSFKKKQVDSINSKEYNSYTVPNESVRSRVAMDFTGEVGRIVEDPNEARAIAAAEGQMWKQRYHRQQVRPCYISRGPGSGSGGPRGTPTAPGLESGVHLTQPWFHSGMTREQAAQLVTRHGTVDGVFLVRESRSTRGTFVLTFRCSGKVLHTQIQPVLDPVRDAWCYSLDSGVTKFYDLLQLVEFYQLNAGCLPTRLTHYVVQAASNLQNNNHQPVNNNLSSTTLSSNSSSGRSSSTPSSPCTSFRGSGVPLLSPDTDLDSGPPCASF